VDALKSQCRNAACTSNALPISHVQFPLALPVSMRHKMTESECNWMASIGRRQRRQPEICDSNCACEIASQQVREKELCSPAHVPCPKSAVYNLANTPRIPHRAIIIEKECDLVVFIVLQLVRYRLLQPQQADSCA
jgi:hypothetical protein